MPTESEYGDDIRLIDDLTRLKLKLLDKVRTLPCYFFFSIIFLHVISGAASGVGWFSELHHLLL